MTGRLLRRLRRIDAGVIHAELTQRQYLFPRKPLVDVLTEVAATLGLTLRCARGAATAAGLDPTRSIGRLTRAQLQSLAQQIHREWRAEIRST